MNRVAAQEYSEPRQILINNIFSTKNHEKVLILGYSCSDEFDLTLQIKNVGRRKEQKIVLFLDHTFPDEEEFKKLENIIIKKEYNPFKEFKKGKRLYYETAVILQQVWEKTISDAYENVSHQDENAGKAEIENRVNKLTEMQKHNISAQILFEISEFKNAIKYWEKALQAAIKAKDVQRKGNIIGNLGTAYRNLGQYKKAIKYFKQGLKISEKIGDVKEKGNHLGNLGTSYSNIGQYEKAIKYYEQALKISEKIGNVRGKGSDLSNLGVAYNYLGQYEKAIEYYEKALKISEKIGAVRGKGNRLGNLGTAYRNLGQYEKAIEYYEKALAILIPMLEKDHPHVKIFQQHMEIAKKALLESHY